MTPPADQSLPFVDEHAVEVEASADQVWAALIGTLERSFNRPGATSYARLVGCADTDRSGDDDLGLGSTVPGFHVAALEPGSDLVLAGRHRFSSYLLSFHLDDVGSGRTRLRAETRAGFPGVGGRAYRALVIGTRAHQLLVRRLLDGMRRRAERSGE